MAGKSRIAGITIELDGDSTELQSALKGVDSQLKTTQSNLRDVNKLLKLDPKNTELLAQKQKNLQTAINTTKKRLETLKSTQTDALSPEKYDALQREIIATEQELEGLEKEYKSFGSVGKQQIKAVASQVKEAGKKVTAFGKEWTKRVTAPIVAVGGLAYKAFTEVDEGLDIIVKKTGATGEALDDMGEIMKDIANSIPTDFATAGEAVGEVNTRFGLTGDALEALSAKFIKFAKLNDTDVSSAIDSVQAAMAAFGVETDRAGEVLDILNKAAQDTGVPVDTLSQQLLANGTALQEMGFEINTAVGFLANLEKNGVDSSTVMAGLKKALQNATKEGKPMSEALDEIQASMLNAATDTEAAQIATELFGAKAGPAIAAAVREGRLSLDDLSSTVTDFGDNVESTFEATLSPADEFNVAMNNLKTLGAEIAEMVMPALSEAMEKVRDVVSNLRDKWNELSDEQKGTVLKIIGIVAAIGPLSTALGGVITLLSGPGGIVVAIGAVVAAGIWLVNHWDEVKAKAKEIWEQITGFFKGGREKIKSIDWAKLGKDMWDKIKAPFVSVGNWLKEKFNTAWQWIKNINWAEVGTWMWGKITGVFANVGGWFKEKFVAAWNAIKNIDWGKIASAIWDKITSGLEGIGDWLKDVFKTPINAVIGFVNKMIGGIESAVNRVIRGINSALSIDISFGTNPFTGKSLGGIKWNPNLKTVSWKRLEYLAKGGVLPEGGRAVVGEVAPEYLTVRNGQAVVTPIQGAERMSGDTITNNFQIYQQPGENANDLANRVIRIMTRQQQQRNNAYA